MEKELTTEGVKEEPTGDGAENLRARLIDLSVRTILTMFGLAYLWIVGAFGIPYWLFIPSAGLFLVLVVNLEWPRERGLVPRSRPITYLLVLLLLGVYFIVSLYGIEGVRAFIALQQHPPFPGATLERVKYQHSDPVNNAIIVLSYHLPNAASRERELTTFYGIVEERLTQDRYISFRPELPDQYRVVINY